MAKVILFSYDPELERVCAAAMRSCYSSHPAYDIFTHRNAANSLPGERPFDESRVTQLLHKAVELGHYDVLEHGCFTFDIQGISRACSHQLVRHRLASFSQQSQRYVKLGQRRGYVCPPALSRRKVSLEIDGKNVKVGFDELVESTARAEEALLSHGVAAEDARYLRPNASETNVVASVNPRELLHVCNLRCAPDAQWEIRGVSWAMFACAQLTAPTMFCTLPIAQHSDYVKARMQKLSKALASNRRAWKISRRGRLARVALESLDLEYPVEAYIRKL